MSLSTFPLAKIVYTAVLIGLVAVLARELYNLWWDHSLYVEQFQYFLDGKADDAEGKAFPAHILGKHQLLRSALIEERQRRAEERQIKTPDKAEVYLLPPSSLPDIARWQTVLSDVELKIQGFDLGKLVTQLRTSISPPDEINGFVEKTGGIVRASVNWPKRPINNVAMIHTPFEAGPLSGEGSVALAVAASIVWAQAANAEPEFAKIPRETFVAWALTWWDYRLIRERESIGDPLSEEDKKRWTQARRLVDKLIGQAEKYPEIWRLRADVIDAGISGGLANEHDKEIAVGDRDQYAIAMGLGRLVIASRELKEAGVIAARPGQPIWARPVGKSTNAPFPLAMTITAIVTDTSGKHKILLPDYAATDGETEYALNPNGPVVARAQSTDIFYVGPSKEVGRGGVVLATLEDKTPANNSLTGAGSLKKVAVPSEGEKLKLFSSLHTKTGSVQKIDGPFVVTEGRITEPGDGGAPVLNEDGDLIAMGYIGSEAESRLLSLDKVFRRAGLKFAP
jgi:hypothetical protein